MGRAQTVIAGATRRRVVGELATQVGLLLGATIAYLGVRAIARGDVHGAHGRAGGILRLEGVLGMRWEAGAQRAVLEHPALVHAFNAVYVWGFWPVVVGALVVLYRVDRARYRQYRNAIFLSGVVGLAVFTAFPVAPPRFLAGFTDTVTELSGQGGVAHPSSFANEYAAMPSFHVGWTVLAVVALLPVIRWWLLRWVVSAYALVMAATVVVTANHYVLDAVAGVALCLGAMAAVTRIGPRVWGRGPMRSRNVGGSPIRRRNSFPPIVPGKPVGA